MKTADQLLEIKGLPVNIDAERFILGSALGSAELLTDMVSSLAREDFALDKHRLMFSRMLEMNQRGAWVDRITLTEELMRRGELEKVDGMTYIVGMEDGLPRLPDIGSYIQIVREKSVLRQTIEACERLKSECLMRQDSPSDLIARGERVMSEIQGKLAVDTEFQTPQEIIAAAGGADAYFRSRRVPGLLTDYQRFNAVTRGLQPGNLVILAARTSKGKSAFASNLAVQIARAGTGVALFSLEMDKQEQNDRILALAGGCTFNALRGNDREVIRKSMMAAGALPIHIDDESSRSVPAIHARVRRLKARTGVGLVIVDYLQLLSPAGRFENRTQEVSAMSRALKLASKDLRIPFLVLSQLKRLDSVPNRPPVLADLRESGSIEQDANMVLFLHSEREYKEYEPGTPAPTTLMIAKQRGGPTEDISMQFWPDRGQFTEGI